MLVVSLYMLFWPDPGGPDTELPGADKVVHALVFLALAGTARLRFGGAPALLVAVLGYAAVSELVQAFLLADRSGDVVDVVADLVGAGMGWAAVAARLRRRG